MSGESNYEALLTQSLSADLRNFPFLMVFRFVLYLSKSPHLCAREQEYQAHRFGICTDD